MLRLRVATVIAAIAMPAVAFASDTPEWRYFGMTGDGKNSQYLFYDAAGIKPLPDNHVQVWTKGVRVADIDRPLDDKKDKDIIDEAAERLVRAQMPPFASVVKLDRDQLVEIIAAETRVDLRFYSAPTKILYEVDCASDKLRELSIYLEIDGKHGNSDEPSRWHYIPPETNAASLVSLVCKPPR
jgi:hypothetical protein